MSTLNHIPTPVLLCGCDNGNIRPVAVDNDGKVKLSTNYKGFYATDTLLIAAYPIGEDGDYALVGSTNTFWIWTSGAWADSGSSSAVTSVFGRVGTITAATDDYTWAQINKTTSDISDIKTRSHTSLTDVGSNSHSTIDSHISSTSNPHTVTKTQVGLGSVENTALSTWAGTSNVTTVGVLTGPLGIGVSPRRTLDVFNASNPQARLTYTDNVIYTDIQTTSAGNLSILPSNEKLFVNTTTNPPHGSLTAFYVSKGNSTFEGADGQINVLYMYAYGEGNAARANVLRSLRANGSKASPTATLAGDLLTVIEGGGYGTTGFLASKANMRFAASENFTDTNTGTRIEFRTTLIGATTTSERFRIHDNGLIDLWQTAGESESATLQLQEKDTTPATPTAGTRTKIYMKSDKLVIQYNDGGTVKYRTLDLTSTDATWAYTTTAP